MTDARHIAVLACACALFAGAPAAGAESPSAKAPSSKAPAPAPASAAAAGKAVAPGSLLVHVDPKTLEISLSSRAGTVPLELTSEILNALDTSSEGLTPVTTPEGTLFDLQGRFHATWIVVTDAEGKARPFCLTALPPEVAAAAKALREREAHRAR